MRVELTEDFELIVTPETAVEGIALRTWSDKYHVISDGSNGPKESPAASLLVRAFGAEEDCLYKTAKVLLEFYDEHGPDQFRMRFGSLDILEPAREIFAEGEGNDHPWRDRRNQTNKE